MSDSFFDMIKYDANGLIPVVIQEVNTKDVLMVAYMNEASLKKTIETKKTWFYSRSRQKFWMKGESSGHIQEVQEIRFDCDVDCLVITVIQSGGACHVGYKTCFYRRLNDDGSFETIGEKIFDPNDVYKK